MQILFLKWVDRVVGGLVAGVLPAARGPESAMTVVPRRVLVIRPGGIGDAVLLIPALLGLKERFPTAEISVLAERRNCSVLSLCRIIDHLLLYDRPSQLARVLGGGYDVVIDTEQWHRLSAAVARLASAPVSIGFATNERKRLFSHQIDYSHDDYEALSFFNLLAPLGISPPATLRAPFLAVPRSAAVRAEALLAPLSGAPFVTLFPGASVKERQWGTERFREVAGSLAARGLPVVVVGGPDDELAGEIIVRGTGGMNLAGKTTLVETAAVLARSLLLLSGDSGVLHIAVGLGVPTVSLFGPGIQAKWGPIGEAHTVLNRELPCSPCTRFGTTPPCAYRARCLSEITVPEVVSAIERRLPLGS